MINKSYEDQITFVVVVENTLIFPLLSLTSVLRMRGEAAARASTHTAARQPWPGETAARWSLSHQNRSFFHSAEVPLGRSATIKATLSSS